jgi:hypothetical protein
MLQITLEGMETDCPPVDTFFSYSRRLQQHTSCMEAGVVLSAALLWPIPSRAIGIILVDVVQCGPNAR